MRDERTLEERRADVRRRRIAAIRNVIAARNLPITPTDDECVDWAHAIEIAAICAPRGAWVVAKAIFPQLGLDNDGYQLLAKEIAVIVDVPLPEQMDPPPAPRPLEWMHELASRDFSAIIGRGRTSGVYAFERDGQRYAAATDGRALVVIPSTADDGLPLHSAAPRADVFEPVGGVEVDFDKLKAWAGEPSGGEVYFSHTGEGPIDVNFTDKALLFGVLVDRNLLAHAIHNLTASGPVRAEVRLEEQRMIRISDGRWFVAMMPYSANNLSEFP